MPSVVERLATLEQQQKDMGESLDKVVATTDNIERTLNELIGAKKVLMTITGAVATIVSIVIAWLGINRH